MEKRSGCYSHICFSTHFFLAFMVELSLCMYLSLGLSRRYLGTFLRTQGNKCLFFDSLCFLETRVPFPLLCVLWGYSASGVGGLAVMLSLIQ